MKYKVRIDRLKAVVPFCVVSYQFSFCQRNAAAHTPPSRRHPRVQRDWNTNMSFGAMVSSLPPALVGLCQGQAQKFGRIFGHPVWSPFSRFLRAISKARMVCDAFQVSSCVHFRSRFLSRPLGAAEVGAWQQFLGSYLTLARGLVSRPFSTGLDDLHGNLTIWHRWKSVRDF